MQLISEKSLQKEIFIINSPGCLDVLFTKARYNHGQELGFTLDRQRHRQEQSLDPHELNLSEEKQEEEAEMVLNPPVEADTGSHPGEAVLSL